MANGNRDVKLTISAQDRASRDIKKITDSLESMVDAQEDVAKSGKGLVGALGNDFKKLATQIDGLKGLERVSGEVDKVVAAQGRLKKSVADQTEALAKANTEYATAAKTTSDLRKSQVALEDAQQRDKKTLADLKTSRKAANDELARTKKLESEVSSKKAQDKAAKAGTDTSIQQALAAANVRAATAEVERHDAKIKALTTSNKQYGDSLKVVKNEVKAAADNEARLRGESEKLNTALTQGQTNLRTASATLKSLQDSANGAAKALGQASIEQTKLAESSRLAEGALRKNASLQEALGKFSTGKEGEFASPKIAAALRQQREAVDQAKQRWQLLNAEMRASSDAMRASGNATSQQVANLRALSNAASAAGKEYKSQVAELSKLDAAMGRTQNSGRGLRGMFASYYGESRKAMSITQRLRGEILSLATGFLGLYAAMGQIKGVVAAYQSLEAAQNRLGVVFQQDTSATNKELAWLERQAGRLGISFKVLSDEYSKFAVAAKAANWEGKNTRKMFLDVAEAARVNKLSTEQTSGVFLALTQMISKGKVSSEELRRQLGDRMAGAFNLFAQALGMTTAELDEAMQKGEVFATESNLLKFGERLAEVYGPQLAKALTSFTTEMGKMENNIYQSQLRIAKGGFIDALQKGMAELNKWFESRAGRDFFLDLGAAMGKVTLVLAQIPKYFDAIGLAIKGFIAFKLAATFTGFADAALKGENAAGRFIAGLRGVQGAAGNTNAALMTAEKATQAYLMSNTRLGTVIGATQGKLAAWNLALTTTATRQGFVGTTATVASAGVTMLSRALTIAAAAGRGLLAAFGGFAGLAIGAAFVGITYAVDKWVLGASDATRAMDEHERIVSKVFSAYETGKGKVEDWRKAIEGVSLIEAESNFTGAMDDRAKAIDNLKKSLVDLARQTSFFGKERKVIDDFVSSFDSSKPEKFKEQFEKLNKEIKDPALKKYIQDAYEQAKAVMASDEAMQRASASAVSLGTELESAKKITGDLNSTMERLTGTTEDIAGKLADEAAESARKYGAALDDLKSKIPELADELKKLKEIVAIDAIVAGLGFDQITPEIIDLMKRGRAAIEDKYTNYEAEYTAGRGTPKGVEMERLVKATTILAEKMGLSAKDLLTVMSYETKGTLDPWQKGPTTQWGEHRGLIQWGEPQRAKYGVTATTSVEDQVKAVGKYLTDAGVKAGDGLLQVYAAINAGSAKKINASDANNGGAPGTVLDKVSGQMAGHKSRADGLLSAYGGIKKEAEETVKAEEKITKEKEKQAEKAKKDLEDAKKKTSSSISDLEFENGQQQLINDKKGRQAAIEKAIRDARKENANITDAELQKITELTGKNYDLKHAQDEVKESKKEAKDIEKELNALVTERNALLQQRKFFEKEGDSDKVSDVDGKIEGLNSKLTETIAKLREMWTAMGGPDAELGLARLNALEMKIERTGQKATISAAEIAQMASTGITNAFKTFAQAVANGEDAMDSLKDAFLQFAADFLLKIAEMIMQAMLLAAIKSMLGGLGFTGISLPTMHTGGVAGRSQGARKTISPMLMAGATRYHSGGIAGLAPNEVPAILEENEEVITAKDPRHRDNGGLNGGANKFNIVNTFDFQSFLSSALNTEAGVETILNVVRANSSAFSQATRG